MVENEANRDLRDTERIPPIEAGGITARLRREAPPYAPDGWCASLGVKVGHGVSFMRCFYKPRPQKKIRADILALERETEDPLAAIVQSFRRM